MMRSVVGLVAALFLSGGATAKTEEPPVLIEAFDLDRLEEALRSQGYQIGRMWDRGFEVTLVTTETGGRIYLAGDVCGESGGRGRQACRLIEMGTIFTGVTVEAALVSEFHAGSVATVAFVPEDEALVLMQNVLSYGGVTEAHFLARFDVFLTDANVFVEMYRQWNQTVQATDAPDESRAEGSAAGFPPLIGEAPRPDHPPLVSQVGQAVPPAGPIFAPRLTAEAAGATGAAPRR